MSEKKWCVRFKKSAAGRRCAKFETGSYSKSQTKRTGKHCKRFKQTKAGKRCASFEKE